MNLITRIILTFSLSQISFAQVTIAPHAIEQVFTEINLISPSNFSKSLLAEQKQNAAIAKLCKEIEQTFHRYGWKDRPCDGVTWQADLMSSEGRPLIYAQFGKGEDTTLLLGGVHPDEITPVHLAFKMARTIQNSSLDNNIRVIVAPLVNPDGFLRGRNDVTRTNAHGVDLNRNFFTADWYEKAQHFWSLRGKRALAHFPGYFPNSEVETIFQIQLIDNYKPDKIISIHAPLGFLDYDGPGSGILRPLTATESKAKRLVKTIAENSRNYKVVDYSFFPGSLGNYAGNERNIPTVTLELETTNPRKVDEYWRRFQPGLQQAIHYPFKINPDQGAVSKANNTTAFSDFYFKPKAK